MAKKKPTTELSALLDFYSDKASAHASFLVAITIGLFAVLTLNDKVDPFAVSSIFFVLWVAGLYTLLNFSYYSEYAVMTKKILLSPQNDIPQDKTLENQIFDKMREDWENTLLRWIYLWLKNCRIPFKPRKKTPTLNWTYLFPLFYSLFGFFVSYFFFSLEGMVLGFILGLFIFFIVIIILDLLDTFFHIYSFFKADC